MKDKKDKKTILGQRLKRPDDQMQWMIFNHILGKEKNSDKGRTFEE